MLLLLLPKRPPPFPSPFKFCCCPFIGEETKSVLFKAEVEEEEKEERFCGVGEETKAAAEEVEDEEEGINEGKNNCGKKSIN